MKALRTVKKNEPPMVAAGSRARASAQTPIRQQAASNQVMQRLLSFGPAPQIQRQPDSPDAPATPTYRDCTESITGISDANERLEFARLRARDFVQAAIAALDTTPAAGSVGAVALARHFINPTDAQRTTIRDNYKKMLIALRVNNFICNTESICGTRLAGWLPGDDLIHVCPGFWDLKYPCKPIIVIHEAAHDADVDASITGHTPDRGTVSYPTGNKPPYPDETTAVRMINPDAYGFYAAHIWRETDTGLRCP